MRTCTRCATPVPDTDQCPHCLAWFERRPATAGMSTAVRLAEFDSWFLAPIPEISNDRVARRIAELVGHPVHPMDLATQTGRAQLRGEIATA